MQNKVLNVLCNGRKVGQLAQTPDRLIAFEYDAEWLRDGFSISPFKLPLEKGVFIAPPEPFDGNFGVFNDSLPDSWGRLLIDRMLLKKRINPADLSILDRLAIVGSSGMGALEYKPEEQLAGNVARADLDTLAREALSVFHENYDGKNLEKLVKLGGSSGGAQPKILPNIDGEKWLIKFRAGSDPENAGQQEFNYMATAKAAGLVVPETRLFEGKYFGVKRFDRNIGSDKVFMISACGLLDAGHRLQTLDYNDLLAATLKLTGDSREVEKIFRLMCFNVFAHNRDDHSKNFSFLHVRGRWKLSPVYDLTYAAGMGGEHATTIDGEGRTPTEENILAVASKADLNRHKAKDIMNEVKTAVKPGSVKGKWSL